MAISPRGFEGSSYCPIHLNELQGLVEIGCNYCHGSLSSKGYSVNTINSLMSDYRRKNMMNLDMAQLQNTMAVPNNCVPGQIITYNENSFTLPTKQSKKSVKDIVNYFYHK